MYQWWIWCSNQFFCLTPASHIPLVCSVETIPSCIYMCVSRIRFILLVFSDVPLHALVTSRDWRFAISAHSFPYQIDLFSTTSFSTLLTFRVWWEQSWESAYMTMMWNTMLQQDSIRATLVPESSTALFKGQRCASKDCHTESPKVTTWAWWFVIHLAVGAAEHVCLLWSFIVRITNYTSGCMKVTSIIPWLYRSGTNVCIWI